MNPWRYDKNNWKSGEMPESKTGFYKAEADAAQTAAKK